LRKKLLFVVINMRLFDREVWLPMYGPHYSDKPPRVSSGKWEEVTFQILKKVFPNWEIQKQARFSFLPHTIIDFYVPKAKIAVECRACGLAPVPQNCDDVCSECDDAVGCALLKNKTRQDMLKANSIQYVWWVDRERAPLVPRTRKYLEHAFYNCLGERREFEDFLKTASVE
jgi:hypothetical protein